MSKEQAEGKGEVAQDARTIERKPKRAITFLQNFALLVIGLHVVQILFTKGLDVLKYLRVESSVDIEPEKIGDVKWFECDFPTIPGIECGTIVVPLDYFNHSEGTSTIALSRYKATKTPSRGTVFLNPGGPGGSGVLLIPRSGKALSKLIGPYFDLVGFDPRGIGRTRPNVRCFPRPDYRTLFVSNTVFEQGFTVSSNLSDPMTRDRLVGQYKEFLSMKKTQADLCAQNMGDSLKYMGTATVVRDIDFMTTVLDGADALINYWGGSYGSILGAYLVNMLPDRIGKVAIDGIANPVLWAAKPSQYWHSDWIASAEDTFKIFLKGCSEAGPKQCPLAHEKSEDPDEIGKRIDKFLDDLYENPLPVPFARRPGVLTAGGVRALFLIFMEAPRIWPMASQFLARAMAGDGRSILDYLMPQYLPYPTPDLSSAADLSRLAVTCLDSPPPASESEFPTAEDLADIGLATIRDVSRHFGMSVSISEPDGGCQFWPVKSPERFTGPWNQTLKNPILIVSNTADPVTPLKSGRLVNSLLGNSSKLLIQNSPGHCSLALTSLCTINAYRAFYINGTLPFNGQTCETDEHPFLQNGDDKISTFSEEDTELLNSIREIGEWMLREKLTNILGTNPLDNDYLVSSGMLY